MTDHRPVSAADQGAEAPLAQSQGPESHGPESQGPQPPVPETLTPEQWTELLRADPYWTARALQEQGSRFYRALGQALEAADARNRRLICQTWPEALWDFYGRGKALAAQETTQEPPPLDESGGVQEAAHPARGGGP